MSRLLLQCGDKWFNGLGDVRPPLRGDCPPSVQANEVISLCTVWKEPTSNEADSSPNATKIVGEPHSATRTPTVVIISIDTLNPTYEWEAYPID